MDTLSPTRSSPLELEYGSTTRTKVFVSGAISGPGLWWPHSLTRTLRKQPAHSGNTLVRLSHRAQLSASSRVETGEPDQGTSR